MKAENIFRFISLYKPGKKAKPRHVVTNPNPVSPCQDKLNEYMSDGYNEEQAKGEMLKDCYGLLRKLNQLLASLSSIQPEVMALINNPEISADPMKFREKFNELLVENFGESQDFTETQIDEIVQLMWEAHCCSVMFPEIGNSSVIDLDFWIKVFELLKTTASTSENPKAKDLLINFKKHRVSVPAEVAIPKERYMNVSSPTTETGNELNDGDKQRKEKIEATRHILLKLHELKQKMEDLYDDKIEENEKKAEKELEEHESKIEDALRNVPIKGLISSHKNKPEIESLKSTDENEIDFFFSSEIEENDIIIKFNKTEFSKDELALLRNHNIKYRNRFLPDVNHDLTLRIAELDRDLFELRTVTEIVRVNGIFVKRKRTLDI